MTRLKLFGSLLLSGAVGAFASLGGCVDEGGGSTTGTPPGTGGGGTGGGGAGGMGGGTTGITIEGLSDVVDAKYDDDGLLHLSCASNEDCYAALGYFHAQNRFFFMDFVRNLVRGRLASLVNAGATVLERDYANRQFFTTPAGEPLEEVLLQDSSADVKAYMTAFSNGVNAWIGDMRAERNGATLTTEYDFALIEASAIRDWEPEDSAAIGLYVLNDLSNDASLEIALGTLYPLFDPSLSADLFSFIPVFDAVTTPSTIGLPVPGAEPGADQQARLAPLRALLGQAGQVLGQVGSRGIIAQHPDDFGSNNWAVQGSRTTSGNAILANDPHLLLSNPSIWFAVELDAKSGGGDDLHVAGSTFPGLPSVMVGHNEEVAWGVTTANWDLTDVYVETISSDGTTVTFNGNDVAIFEKDFTFDDVSTGTPVTKTFRYVPHHGPLVSDDGTTGVSVRWRAHEGGTDLDAFFGLAVASTVEEGRQAVESVVTANQNFVIIDSAGDLGWYPYVDMPGRSWASLATPPWLPLPGDGSAEWEAALPKTSLPQLTNPPSGAVATANQDLTGASLDGNPLNDGQASLQSWGKAEGTREQRIVDRLTAGGNAHSVDTMNALHGDSYSLYGEVMVPAFLTAAAGMTPTADEQAVIDALTAWQYDCPTGLDGSDPVMAGKSSDTLETAESIGCAVFHTTLYAAVEAALADEIAASTADPAMLASLRAPLHLVVRAVAKPTSLVSGDLMWDDVTTTPAVETRDDVFQTAISRAAAALVQTFGSDPDDWRWGRIHNLTLVSIFDAFGLPMYNLGPYAAPGGQYTVNVANPRSRAMPTGANPLSWGFTSGPSVRFVVEATPTGMQMTYQLPGGNDLHRDSPFFNNLLPKWLAVESIVFPFGPDAVPNPAVEVQVNPAP